MSKNLQDIEANPLNLSLTGSQIIQAKNSNRHQHSNVSRRPPSAHSHRSNSSINLSIEPSKKDVKQNGHSYLNSNRASSNFQQSRPKIPLNNPWLRKNEEKENQAENKKTKESMVFTPLSVRSSTDEFDSLQKINDFITQKEKVEGLDLFFNSQNISDSKDSSRNKLMLNLKQSESYSNGLNKYADSESDFKLINPIKDDDKITKLITSVDTLRKELQSNTITTSNSNSSNDTKKNIPNNKSLENTRRKLAAIKIQTWYRKHLKQKRDNQQSEIEKLFSQKKTEMKKKMETNLEKNSVFGNKKSSFSTSKSSFKSERPPSAQKSARILKIEDLDIKSTVSTDRSLIEKMKAQQAETKANVENEEKPSKNTANGESTVESLLLSLDKIEKESESLLPTDNKLTSNASSVTNEKINSILSFLDEAATSESNNFIPRPMKDYKFDTLVFNNNLNNKSSPPVTPKKSTSNPKPPFDTKFSARKQSSSAHNDSSQQTPKISPKSNKNDNEIDLEKIEKVVAAVSAAASNSITPDISNTILQLRLELEEKKRTAAMLEKALSQQRELTIRHTQEADKEMQIRLEAQKNDYEATIQRHLGFIDQLIDDKKNLSEKCEKLVKELKEIEKNYSDRLRTSEERFKVETQKMKSTFEAAEKIRQEKWIEEKSKKIKEMTIKGLEPEIQAMIVKHKNEIKALKATHDADMLQADERAAQRYIRITEELRENYEREKETSIQKEREMSKQRYEKSLQDEEKSFLEQRRRLYAEIEEEKNRIAEQGAIQRREFDRLKKMLEENNLSTIESIKKEYTNAQQELEKKHQAEIQNLKEKLEIEKQSWEENYMKKKENWILQKERELKEQIKKDRNKEIELVIARLEQESTTSREEVERTAENRIKRIRDKYESELKEVEKTERETMERYNTLKAKYNELECECERLKVICKQKEKDLEGIKKLTDVLQDERNRLADVIRQDFSDRIVFTEEENKRIKLEMAELKSRHQVELDRKKEEFEKLQRDKTEELNTVHEKIKQVVAKKDEMLNQLRQQYDSACKRADHLEGLLEQQRTLMLKKQSNSNT